MSEPMTNMELIHYVMDWIPLGLVAAGLIAWGKFKQRSDWMEGKIKRMDIEKVDHAKCTVEHQHVEETVKYGQNVILEKLRDIKTDFNARFDKLEKDIRDGHQRLDRHLEQDRRRNNK